MTFRKPEYRFLYSFAAITTRSLLTVGVFALRPLFSSHTSLADVSAEAIADVYENALLDNTAIKARGKHGQKAPSIRKQLGLELKSGKGPREFLIIDHLERPSGY